MRLQAGERRRSDRLATAATAILRTAEQRFITRCSVINVSDGGVFVMTHDCPELPRGGQVYLEMAAPQADNPDGPRQTTVHLCRIVRAQQMGALVGLGLAFIERLV